MPKGKPKTKGRISTPSSKTPKTLASNPVGEDEGMPKFSFRYVDLEDRDEWSWPDDATSKEIFKFLSDMSNCTWNEILGQTLNGHKKHHSHAIETVCKEARDLISSFNHDKIFEDLFRFRLTAKKRLWGYRKGGTFYPLWWDPEHKIYPTDPE